MTAWQVCRRFSDFQALDAALRSSSPSLASALPPLPSAITFNKMGDAVVASRRVALHRHATAM